APIRALGAIDQHSQVQLYTEGPDDKFYTIISIKNRGCKAEVPLSACKALAPLSYMEGKDIGEMLSLEAMSTAAAMAKAGRPLVWIEAERLDEKTLGGLIFFYEYMTAMTGLMMGINPFDQPGVEQGKRYTYGLMGKNGYEKDALEAEYFFAGINKRTLRL
ncbi:MAG: glucose-6-phosphate isomerase, partial [Synergistaceae bacterium]